MSTQWSNAERNARFFEHANRLRPDLSLENLEKMFEAPYSTYNYAVYCAWRNSPASPVILDGPGGPARYDSDDVLDRAVRMMVEAAESRLHFTKYLEKYDIEEKQSGRCYRTGSHKVRRQDGTRLTNQDIAAIKNITYGQEHRVGLESQGMYASVYWGCDSSD